MSFKYYDCVSVAIAMKHAERLGRIILFSVGCPALPYFSKLSHERHDFRGDMNMQCVFWFSLQLSSEAFLILRRI